MPKPGSTEPTFGPTWPNDRLSEAIVRSQIVASTLPPPIAIAAARGDHRLRHVADRGVHSSIGTPMVPRPSYLPSCADWSPPVQKARSPAPVSTMHADVLVLARLVERLDQFVAGRAAEGVHLVGTVDGDPGDAVGALRR